MTELILTTIDQQKIYCTLFLPTINSRKKIIIINSATGVRQQVYFAFATYLSTLGYTVLTYDYRGIGLSKPKQMKNSVGSMRDWGSKDFNAVTQYISKHFPDYEKYGIGHSVGALIFGMNPDVKSFNKLIFVATQNAFYGHLNFKTKISAFLGFSIVQPLTTNILGYFPGHLLGLGESLPKGAAVDWAHLILKKKSTDYLLENVDSNISKQLNQKTFVVYASDDNWITEKGVKSLLNDTYPNLKPTYRIINPEESPNKIVGHVNFFRSYNKTLWPIIEQQLNTL